MLCILLLPKYSQISLERKILAHNSLSLRKKCSYLEFFGSVFSGIWSEYGENVRIQSKRGKMRARKTLNTNTFHAVNIIKDEVF